jgi:hypothetical protein
VVGITGRRDPPDDGSNRNVTSVRDSPFIHRRAHEVDPGRTTVIPGFSAIFIVTFVANKPGGMRYFSMTPED